MFDSAVALRIRLCRFEELKRAAGGMLNTAIYERMHQMAQQIPSGCDVLEIGAGGGAGTVALAWGLAEGDKSARVIAVERCVGGSRLRYGGFTDNLRRLRKTLRMHGVSDRVRLLPIDLHEHAYAQVLDAMGVRRIGLLILDADGRLDRDLPVLWPYLHSNAHLVIDDCIERTAYSPVSDTYPMGGAKFTLTARVMRYMIEAGLLDVEDVMGKTVIARAKMAGGGLSSDVCSRICAIRDAVRLEWASTVMSDANFRRAASNMNRSA